MSKKIILVVSFITKESFSLFLYTPPYKLNIIFPCVSLYVNGVVVAESNTNPAYTIFLFNSFVNEVGV
jgi:hypothetical protein